MPPPALPSWCRFERDGVETEPTPSVIVIPGRDPFAPLHDTPMRQYVPPPPERLSRLRELAEGYRSAAIIRFGPSLTINRGEAPETCPILRRKELGQFMRNLHRANTQEAPALPPPIPPVVATDPYLLSDTLPSKKDADTGVSERTAPSSPPKKHVSLWSQSWALAWEFLSVGNRPKDTLLREAAWGSHLFDRLNEPEAQKRFPRPARWAQQGLREFNTLLMRQVVPYFRAFYSKRLRYLRRLRAYVAKSYQTTERRALLRHLKRLVRCIPTGARVGWVGNGDAAKFRPCGCSRVCPWCRGRALRGLVDRVVPKLSSDTSHVLVVVRLELRGSLDEASVGMARRVIDQLRERLAEVGLSGGITCQDIAPIGDHNAHVRTEDVLHVVSILGQADLSRWDQMERFFHTLEPLKHSMPFNFGFHTRVHWATVRGANADAVRTFLAGRTLSSSRTRCYRHSESSTEWETLGSWRGILNAPRFEHFTPSMWTKLHHLFRGKPLFVPFGDWRSIAATTSGNPMQTRGLKDSNESRKRKARMELARLARVVKPIWEGMRKNNEPVTNATLKQAIQSQGIVATDWQARKLIRVMGGLSTTVVRQDLSNVVGDPSLATLNPSLVARSASGGLVTRPLTGDPSGDLANQGAGLPLASLGDPKPTERPFEEVPGYWVSSEGEVLRLTGKPPSFKAVPTWVSNGYPTVELHDPKTGVAVTRFVHAMVAATFLGPRPEGAEICHRDGNRQNNHPSNLAWGSREDNLVDRVAHDGVAKGNRNGNSKLSDEEALIIRELCDEGKVSRARIASIFSVSQMTVSSIANRKSWTHLP
jgi:hypothetical protein